MSTTINPVTPLEGQERLKRADDLRQTLASLRLEGLTPDDDTLAILEQHVNGDISLEEMGAALDGLHDRQFGSLPLSGHTNP